MTGSDGSTLTTYEWNDNTLTITLPTPGEGQSGPDVWKLTYNHDGLLTDIVNPLELTTTIEYESYRFKSATNPDGTTWSLEPAIVSMLPQSGDGTYTVTYALSPPGEFISTYTDPRGNEWIYKTDHHGLITSLTNPEANDPGLDYAAVLGKEWKWERDDNGRLEKYIEPAGGGGYNGSLDSLETEYLSYDGQGNCTKIKYPDGTTEEWTYDPDYSIVTSHKDQAGRETTYSLNGGVDVETMTEINTDPDPLNAGYPKPSRDTKYEYTPAPISINDVPGGLLTKIYHACDSGDEVIDYLTYYTSGTSIGLLHTLTSAYGTAVAVTTQYGYDLRRNPLYVEDALGRRTETTYDALGRLVVVKEAAGTSDQAVTKYHYDEAGNLDYEISPRGNVTGATADDFRTDYQYDEMNRLKYILPPLPGASTGSTQIPAIVEYQYDANGNRTKEILHLDGDYVESTDDRITKYVYDERNLLIEVEQGSPFEPIVGPSDLPDALTAPLVKYSYDTLGNLRYETDPRNESIETRYTYDEMGRVKTITQPDPGTGAPVTTYQYFPGGQVQWVKTSGPYDEVQTDYLYDSFGRLVKTVLPSDGYNTERLATLYEYDLRDNIIHVYEGGVAATGDTPTTRHTVNRYDDLNRLIAIDYQNPVPSGDGLVTLYAYNDAGEVIRELHYPGQFDPSYVSADGPTYYTTLTNLENAASTLWAAGKNAAITHYSYDNQGRLKHVVSPDPDGSGSEVPLHTEYAYDAADNVTDIVLRDASGGTELSRTKTEYDNLDRAWRTYTVAPGVAAPDRPESQILFNTDGTVKKQRTTTTDANGNNTWNETVYEYDGLGRVWKTTVPDPTQTSPTNTQTTVTYYDGAGNLLRSIDVRDGGAISVPSSFTYDNLNRQVTSTVPVYGVTTGNTTITTTYTYKADGSIQKVENTATGEGGRTEYTYDNLGRVKTQTDYRGTDSSMTQYGYDVFGNCTSLIDPEQNETKYAYDSIGQLFKEQIEGDVDNDGSNETLERWYRYDGLGNLTYTIDRNGRLSAFTHDNLGRKTSETWYGTSDALVDGTTVDSWIDYQLVNMPPVYEAFYTYTIQGQLDTAEDTYDQGVTDHSSYDYGYDTLGRVDDITLTYGGVAGETFQLDYAYQPFGALLSVETKTSGTEDHTNTYKFDTIGRMVEVQQTGPTNVQDKTVTFEYGYDASQKSLVRDVYRFESLTPDVTSDLFVHSQTKTYLDGRHNLTEHEVWRTGTGGSDKDIASYITTYNEQGLVYHQQVKTFDIQVSWTRYTTDPKYYQYDESGQLTTVATDVMFYDVLATYDYDDAGNRSSGTVADYNRLLDDGTYGYEYDAEGNMIERWPLSSGVPIESFEYDHHNRLTHYEEHSDASGTVVKSIDYLYDVFSQLIGREVTLPSSTDTIEYYVNERGQRVLTLEPYEDLGETEYRVTTRKLWDQAVDQLLASEAYNYSSQPTYHETFWPLSDHQGTVRDIYSTTSSGDKAEHTAYDAFGRPDLVQSAGDGTAEWYVDSFHAGREYDEYTELYFNRARWYDPVSRRWLSEDPLGFAAGDANLYRYCGNSPTNATDPSGRFVVTGTVIAGTMLYGTYLAHSAETDFNEAAEMNAIAPREWTPAEYARQQELVESASWNLATANIAAVAGQAYLSGLGLGMLATGSYALGVTGAVFRGATIVGFGGVAAHGAYGLISQYSTMSPVERYEAVGSLAAGVVAGYAGFKGTYGMKGLRGYRGYLNAKFGRTGNLHADINARGAGAGRLYSYYVGAQRPGPFESTSGRVYMTKYAPDEWLTDKGIVASVRRLVRTGRWKPYADHESYFVTAEGVEASVYGLKPVFPRTANFWKRFGGQYHTRIGTSGFELAPGSSRVILPTPIASSTLQVWQAYSGLGLEVVADTAFASFVSAGATYLRYYPQGGSDAGR